jgi:YD repeat-containing protein
MMDMEYRYSATQNNGQITQQKEWATGEEVTYQYDSLQRLISAVTTGPCSASAGNGESVLPLR